MSHGRGVSVSLQIEMHGLCLVGVEGDAAGSAPRN